MNPHDAFLSAIWCSVVMCLDMEFVLGVIFWWIHVAMLSFHSHFGICTPCVWQNVSLIAALFLSALHGLFFEVSWKLLYLFYPLVDEVCFTAVGEFLSWILLPCHPYRICQTRIKNNACLCKKIFVLLLKDANGTAFL